MNPEFILLNMQSTDDAKASEAVRQIAANIVPVLMTAAILVASSWRQLKAWIDEETERHRKGQLRRAYSMRSSWNKGDEDRLARLGASGTALRQAHARGKGRPVIPKYHPWPQDVAQRLVCLLPLFVDGATARDRRAAFWLLPMHEEILEAVYRNEREALRNAGVRGAGEKAELNIKDVLCASTSTIHQACGRARKKSRISDKDTHDPLTISLEDFRAWIECGEWRID